MVDHEDAVLRALEAVAAKGDVAPPGDHSPATSVMRELLHRDALIAWDDGLARYVVTGHGRERIARRRRRAGQVVLHFRPRSQSMKPDGTRG